MKRNAIFSLVILYAIVIEVENTPSMAIPRYVYYFCKGHEDVSADFTPGLYSGYTVKIRRALPASSILRIKFDSSAAILIGAKAVFTEKDLINNIFKLMIMKDTDSVEFTVRGSQAPFHAPYITSIKINDAEICHDASQTFFGDHPGGGSHKFFSAPDQFCGRRRLNRKYTELIVSGSATKYGDWPWHAAIYRYDRATLKYICGGTLISKFLVLTAAHCATIRGESVVPDSLGVVLGKFSLYANDIAAQSKEVFKVISHDEYNHRNHANDIALLKLRTEAIFNNFVQPACLWFDAIYDQIGTHDLKGMVVGWGFDQNDKLTSELHEGLMPQVSDLTCIKHEPVFYSTMLDGKKFCAGFSNGTSACNGDSGGAYLVFVQDIKLSEPLENPSNVEKIPGAWYVRGIVSTSLARKDAAICDPNAYAVFTDISKYTEWLQNNMKA